jgi:hypothetical protein
MKIGFYGVFTWWDSKRIRSLGCWSWRQTPRIDGRWGRGSARRWRWCCGWRRSQFVLRLSRSNSNRSIKKSIQDMRKRLRSWSVYIWTFRRKRSREKNGERERERKRERNDDRKERQRQKRKKARMQERDSESKKYRKKRNRNQPALRHEASFLLPIPAFSKWLRRLSIFSPPPQSAQSHANRSPAIWMLLYFSERGASLTPNRQSALSSLPQRALSTVLSLALALMEGLVFFLKSKKLKGKS